jgi:hypothetical protein
MLLPASGEQIKKLGVRLASGAPISANDDRALEELVACHLQALQLARPRLDDLDEATGTGPLHITARAKTTGTIIEKLRREGNMSLARMGDLAGFRIVGGLDLGAQDRLYDEIARRFPPDPRPVRRVDRRADPSHGYRALHALVSFDGVSIEIQIRTFFQHIWADMMERLADRLGRQIRYGDPPLPPPGISQGQADAIVLGMIAMSTTFAAREHESSWQHLAAVDIDTAVEEAWSGLRLVLHNAGVDF